MKTPEQIQDYLKYIRRQREQLVPETRKPNPSAQTQIAAFVASEVESALEWVLDLQPADVEERLDTHFLSRFLSKG
jgi:hypothetical protein